MSRPDHRIIEKYNLTAEEARNFLSYDPDTGLFVWLRRTSPLGNDRTGLQAGTSAGRGYILIVINGKKYFAHRLAFLFMHGEWPSNQIDHIDGDRANNKWSNLRSATTSQNRVNRIRPQGNSLPRGVVRRGNSFSARITKNGVTKWLGSFSTALLAHAAYLDEAKYIFGDFLTERSLVSRGSANE